MALSSVVWLTAFLLFSAPGDVQDDRQEFASLQGTWEVDMAHEGGQPIPRERREKAKLTVEGSRFTLVDGTATHKGEMGLRFKEKPKGLDLFVETGGSETIGVLGIYKLEKDTLTVCLCKQQRRPTDFKTELGDANVLIVFKRAKGEKAPH